MLTIATASIFSLVVLLVAALAIVVALAPAMSTVGSRTITGGSGTRIMITADGKPEWKHGGITLDWSTVTALGADTVVDGRTIFAGDKYIRYGTPLDVITASGKYGPVDTTVADGREAMAAGQTYLLNETVVQSDEMSDHPAVLEGGLVYRARLNIGGVGQATEANLLLAMPRLRLVRETA